MIKFLDYSDAITVDQLDAILRESGAQGVAQYLGGDFALRPESPSVIAGIQARGWPVMGIWVSSVAGRSGSVDAASCATAARTAQLPAGRFVAVDIEPDIFSQFPAASVTYADAFNDTIRGAGYSPVVYGAP